MAAFKWSAEMASDQGDASSLALASTSPVTTSMADTACVCSSITTADMASHASRKVPIAKDFLLTMCLPLSLASVVVVIRFCE